MKKSPSQVTVGFVPPPGETTRDSVAERRSAAHLADPAWRWQHTPKEHDHRWAVAAGSAPQRVRARQMELRTAAQCHLRTHRRSGEAS